MRRPALAALLTGLALVASGCGGGGRKAASDDGVPPPPTAMPSNAPTTAAPSTQPPTTTAPSPTDGPHQVTYRVDGTGQAQIHYRASDTETTPNTTVALPWTKTVTLTRPQYASIVAAGVSANGTAHVSCLIAVDKVVTSQNTNGWWAQCPSGTG